MNNLMLGKVLKAMYKLSGKTLPQLSDETGLTVDTINNLFYARIQKPGLAGVNTLVQSMGFSLLQLMTFMDENPELPDECDITELFTKYITCAADTNETAAPAKDTVPAAKGNFAAEIELLNSEHEKQLDRFRATHQRYAAQLQEQHDRQIAQLQEHTRQLEQHFEKSTLALKEAHSEQTERMDKEHARQRRTVRILAAAVCIETLLIMLILVFDMFMRNTGWIR